MIKMDPEMELVHDFTNELFSLYDLKIPISDAKMDCITKSAMKAIKFYKNVVHNLEKFMLECKPEYMISGLHVIDSIVQQSRHQFGAAKDVFAPRFARNMEDTFAQMFRCSHEDKSKIIHVLNLWQKNNVFAPEVIQPLFDLLNCDHSVHQAFMQQQQRQKSRQTDAVGLNVHRKSPLQSQNNSIKFENPNISKPLQNTKQFDMQRYLNDMPCASNSMIDSQQSQKQEIILANINSFEDPLSTIDKDHDVELAREIMPVEIIPVNSRSPTPKGYKQRKSRSRSRDKNRYGRHQRSRSKSRSRSYSRSPRNKRKGEIDIERRRKGLTYIKKEHLSVCTTTLWVGHLSKLVQQEELSDTFGKYGDIISIDIITSRGCAYIVMDRRQDAYKAMQALQSHKMQNSAITISWAPGKGVKSREWKNYYDQTLGVTYIPFNKLTYATDFESLEEDGMYDEDTMPTWVKEKLKQPQNKVAPSKKRLIMPQVYTQEVDTSQPPPNLSLLSLMPEFTVGARPIHTPGPVKMPLGVPPPNMLFPGITNQILQQAQPTATNMAALMMGAGQDAVLQNSSNSIDQQSDEFNSRMSNRNKRSLSVEKDGRKDFRSRGSRDCNKRRSGQSDSNNRYSVESIERERSRLRDGIQQINFNRRERNQLDNEGLPSRQRSNDFGRRKQHETNKTVGIFGVPSSANINDIIKKFTSDNKLTQLTIPRNRDGFKGYMFFKYATTFDAEKIINNNPAGHIVYCGKKCTVRQPNLSNYIVPKKQKGVGVFGLPTRVDISIVLREFNSLNQFVNVFISRGDHGEFKGEMFFQYLNERKADEVVENYREKFYSYEGKLCTVKKCIKRTHSVKLKKI